MGTSCAPSYANLYLGEWELMLTQSEHMRPYVENVIIWYHYIDDILFVWDRPSDKLLSFLHELNNNIVNLTFTMIYNHSSITFLDVTIHKVELRLP